MFTQTKSKIVRHQDFYNEKDAEHEPYALSHKGVGVGFIGIKQRSGLTVTCYVKGSKYGKKLTRRDKHRPMTSYMVQFEIYRKDTVQYLVWVLLSMPV